MACYRITPDVFHIGYQRTGSTWLQKGLFPKLADQLLVLKTRQWDIYHATGPEDVRELYDDVLQKAGRVVLESEEALSGGRFRDNLEMAKKISWVNPNARIMICVRSQYDTMASFYYLYVRKGGAMSFPHYVRTLIENRKFDYWALYSAYSDVFSPDNVKVFLFEDLATDPAAYTKSVLDWLGVDISPDIPGNRFRNQSPRKSYIAMLRMINVLAGLTSVIRGIGDNKPEALLRRLAIRRNIAWPIGVSLHLLETILPPPGRAKLPGNLRSAITELYAPGNRRLFDMLQRPISGSAYPGGDA